ncbi:amino acid ABC transporter substrate-binding protein [Changchengzhania lutea]|uniref:amino acid ABC transporter substrate-binding protein n=1 Tax=Changchengzhania lutea TaxID=2049305 RepID=UPI00115C7148|nr:LysM peptidoglycan-binding domain-containing protein [Changchengzhania lutea]
MNKIFLVLILILAFGSNTVKAQNFSTHQVKKGETVEEIAQRYYITTNDIFSLNPDAKKELKPNTILIIPLSKANKPITVVTQKLNGFKKHKTRRKETLYSISKRYNVSQDDIKKYNKFLYANPLRKGDKLQIPVYITSTTTEVPETSKTYIVQPKEGKWRIAYKFGITLSELEALNPKMGEVLQEGQQIYVPNITETEEKEIDEKYGYYKVLPKEGFYRLKLKLGLEQEALEALNPELKETGLKEGMILKTPYSEAINSFEGIDYNATNLLNRRKSKDVKHIAVMLPFRLHRVAVDSVSGMKSQINKDPYLDASLDFYSGVLMAIDSLKTIGVSLKVDVYDTKYQEGEVSDIIDRNNFENVDAVIGPLTPNTFARAASKLSRLNVPIVSPISSDLNLLENVFQTRTTDELLRNRIIDYIKSDSLVNHVVIISDSKNTNIANNLKGLFPHASLVYSRKDKKNGKDENYVIVDDIRDALKSGKNVVFLETQNAGFVSNVTSILASLALSPEAISSASEGSQIVLATTNINSAFESDDVSNMHLSKLQFHFAAASKWFNEEDNNSFIKKYEKTYFTTPNKRAIRGFDLTMDVVLRLVTSEDIYQSVNDAPLTEYVENKFAYKKKLFGGYYNNSVYLVKHQDLRIVSVE